MVALDPAPLADAAVAVASPAAVAGSLAALGVLGVTDWILGDDDPPEGADESGGDAGSGMFDEPETAGDGGIAGMGDDDGGDEFAFDDDEGGGDAFDEFDVGGMDDAGGGGSAQVRELEGRVDEIEDELSSISSTVSTVRTENEQISESVDDIEENVRKLLDIYKMVTKGVNPFVDEDGANGFAGGEGASLGLFDQGQDDEEQPGQLDEDVTDANAEEFFDDDFEEDEVPEEDEAPEVEEEEEEDADDTEESMAQSDDAPTDEEGGAKSFDELREEYEDGADWSEEDAAADEEPEAEVGQETEVESETEEEVEPNPVEEPAKIEDEQDTHATEGGVDDEGAADERVDALFEEDDELQAEEPEPEPEPEPAHETGAHQPPAQPASQPAPQPPRTGARQPAMGGAGGEKPYLRELPSGYVSDLLVMEWIEFLVTESSPSGAHRAITYYENVGWIGHRAADQLREFVDGHPEASVDEDEPAGTGALTMDHHTTSLRYVARITGDVQENVLDSWDEGDNRWLHR
ncbi:flagella protein [Salinarchaeum sp. Harcht-Bsk1]|uniref:FlaD/FlaE family flagellar protein n=1 Tax=Salinarchaeum sp. Harcht-Bsk1 TaxID=1333523 RepID=UPI0003423354|nr:FlaD/FlaE family flagellar protein [Salinarchaeum sp. Harcht-Bsk1]AGN00419.1 flagella protein [Salinarchaeum sp. Harcht-Bsk1]